MPTDSSDLETLLRGLKIFPDRIVFARDRRLRSFGLFELIRESRQLFAQLAVPCDQRVDKGMIDALAQGSVIGVGDQLLRLAATLQGELLSEQTQASRHARKGSQGGVALGLQQLQSHTPTA